MIRRVVHVLFVGAATAALTACGSSAHHASGSSGTALIGTFKLTAGQCTSGTPTGTYFRMIDPGGTIEHGKFFSNPDSKCPDKSFTVQAPGVDGGLVTDSYQPGPSNPFDATGNALASRITEPGSFTAIKFGISTDSKDPQTHKSVPSTVHHQHQRQAVAGRSSLVGGVEQPLLQPGLAQAGRLASRPDSPGHGSYNRRPTRSS